MTVVLTVREVDVLTLAADGKSNLEIGRELHVSAETVKAHKASSFRKLGARNTAQAIALGIRDGLVPLPAVLAVEVPTGTWEIRGRIDAKGLRLVFKPVLREPEP